MRGRDEIENFTQKERRRVCRRTKNIKKAKVFREFREKRLELFEREGRRKKKGSTKKTQEFICWIRIDEKSKPTTPERERERERIFMDLCERDQKEDMKELVEDEEESK